MFAFDFPFKYAVEQIKCLFVYLWMFVRQLIFLILFDLLLNRSQQSVLR